MIPGDRRQRLAAILAADAVGYSRLMEHDERGTVHALDAARAVFSERIEANGGRIVNTAGDSVLALFDTAAGAVAAALEIQRDLAASADAVPEERRMRFRVGVHLGDVIEQPGGDVYGDGVNIAARLQAIAAPGGIVVSEAVRGAVKNRVATRFNALGTQSVKNIADPVRAYAVVDAGNPATPAAAARTPFARRAWGPGAGFAALGLVGLVGAAMLWSRYGAPPPDTAPTKAAVAPAPAVVGKPSIAVLPFDNMSGEADKAYFADGMTEDIITDLSKVAGLTVIARNSSFQYKGKARDVREIGKALNARYVLEGSIRRSGESVRVNAQLIDAATGAHVWAERYDGDLKNIFGVQDTITRSVVKALSVELTKDESERVAKRGTGNVQAYDKVLKGWAHYLQQTPDAFRLAIDDFHKAIELEPAYGRAHAALAAIYWETYTRYWGPAVGIGRKPSALADQSLAQAMRDPTPLAHQVASAMHTQGHQHDQAVAEAQRGVAIDPNDADGHVALANALVFAGRPSEALEEVERGMRLNPHFPSSYAYRRGLALFGLGRLDEAAASLERALALNGDDYWSQRLLLAVYGLTGKREAAARLAEALRSRNRGGLDPSFDPLTIRAVAFWYPFARADDARRFADGLAKAGVPG